MKKYPWLIHPIFVFSFSLLALICSLALYIHWYLEASEKLDLFVSQHGIDPKTLLTSQTWIIILVLSLLVAIILGGLGLIFSYYQKAIKLYRHQKNFIDGFTHELKTPIASLKLYIETFLKHDFDRQEQLKYFEYMKEDTRRLSQNVDRVLNLAKLESSKNKIEFQKISLKKFMNDYLEKNKIIYKNIEISLIGFENDYTIQLNINLFEMLISNIIENAIKYNNCETVKIIIELVELKNCILLNFIDNGIGIPKSELKKIFSKFYQIGRSDNMTAKGNGLGLNLAQHIAKLHKAKIEAFSEGKDKGSTFSIKFPKSKVVRGNG